MKAGEKEELNIQKKPSLKRVYLLLVRISLRKQN